MSGRVGHEVPDLALSYAELALLWPRLPPDAEATVYARAAAAAAAAKLLLTTGRFTGVGVTLRPALAFWWISEAAVNVASRTTCT